MKLIGSLTLIWTLCRTAEALSCYNCTDLSCASPGKQTCSSSEPMCITASSQVSGEQLIYKGCESSSVCLSSGHSTLSLSTRQMTVSALCCNTSDCNNRTLAVPASPVPNSLQCFSCALANCSEKISCSGEESQCFSSTLNMDDQEYPFMGCMTRNLCDADLGRLVQEDVVPLNISRLSCCGTSLCNNPPVPPMKPVPPEKPIQTSGGSGVKLELTQLLLGLLVCALVNGKSIEGW